MSGGVDSSVVAALLKKQGYDVVGFFMMFWSDKSDQTQNHAELYAEPRRKENRCCSEEAYEDAKRVAAKLNIPLYTFNLEKEFKKAVVDYFVREYAEGRTPNPCVMCNKEIKFRLFLDKARAMGADYIATGHYSRRRRESQNHAEQNAEPRRKLKLLIARDKNKDQSYFLWTLGQEQLKHILFPIGDYTKPQVRKMAKKFGLPVSEKKDSQEVCFVNTNLNEFLKKRIKTNRGSIVSVDGKRVGEHKGFAFYTIGQRKGIEIGGIGPFYVVDKNYKNNSLIVASSRDNDALCKKELVAENVNWISGSEPKLPIKIKAKIRYKHEAAAALITQMNTDEKADDVKRHPERSRRISLYGRRYRIVFNKPQRAITPGQSVVFYKGDEMLGGGVIELKSMKFGT